MIDVVIAGVLAQAVAGSMSLDMAGKCFVAEAQKQQISLLLAASVMKNEAGRVGFERQNKDGSWDLGPMQINTVHLRDIQKWTGLKEHEVRRSLVWDMCANVATGMWLLRRAIDRSGDVWAGVGAYHSRSPGVGDAYAFRVKTKMWSLYEAMSPAGRWASVGERGELALVFAKRYARVAGYSPNPDSLKRD